MNENARCWLPAEAFSEENVTAVLAEPISDWSKRWVAKQAIVVSSVSQGGEAREIVAQGTMIDVSVTGAGKRHLLEAALDVELASEVLSADDHRVLGTFVNAMLDQLVAVLENFVPAEREPEDDKLRVGLSTGGFEVLSFCIPSAALVSKLKARLRTSSSNSGSLQSRAAAVAGTRVRLEGILGRVEVALSAFQDLAVGDVLILDRSLHDTIELRLAGSKVSMGGGKLVQSEGRLSLVL